MAQRGAASLYDEFVEEARGNRGPVCSVSRALEQMDAKERETVVTALSDPVITATAIARVLKRRGYDVSGSAMQRHRRGVCCAR